jgi:hypothetical protein
MLRTRDIYRALIAILAGYALVGAGSAQNNSQQAADLLEKAYLAATQYPPVAYNADSKSSEMRFSVTYYQRGRELDIAVMRHDVIDGEERPVLKAREVCDGSRMIHYDTRSIEGPLRPQRVDAYFTSDKTLLAILRARSSTCAHLDGWSDFDHEHLSESMKNADTLVLLDEMETVGGNACYVLESSGPRGHHKVWIDPEHGYHIRKAFIEKKADDLYGTDTVAGVGNSSFKTLIEVVKFENVDGVWFPVEATEDRTWGTLEKDGTEKFRNSRVTTTRSNIHFNPDFQTLGAFVMDLPDGTTLQNLESPGAEYVWINGAIRPYVEPHAPDIAEPEMDRVKQERRPTQKTVVGTPTDLANTDQPTKEAGTHEELPGRAPIATSPIGRTGFVTILVCCATVFSVAVAASVLYYVRRGK